MMKRPHSGHIHSHKSDCQLVCPVWAEVPRVDQYLTYCKKSHSGGSGGGLRTPTTTQKEQWNGWMDLCWYPTLLPYLVYILVDWTLTLPGIFRGPVTKYECPKSAGRHISPCREAADKLRLWHGER
jgi:hypothetical protein